MDGQPVPLGDHCHPLAEKSLGDNHDLIACGKKIGDDRFQCTAAGTGKQQHIVLRAHDPLQPRKAVVQQRGELRAAVVDQWPGQASQNALRNIGQNKELFNLHNILITQE